MATGTCTLTASQPGNAVYAAAPSVSRSFTVSKAPQSITFPDPGPQSMVVADRAPEPVGLVQACR